MKISLLLEREDFGAQLERTLSAYLTNRTRTRTRAEWRSLAPTERDRFRARDGVFLCQPELNLLAPLHVSSDALDLTRREFSSHPTRWRRPLQRSYVRAALSQLGRRILSRYALFIDPPVPGSERWVILGGLRRIRIVDWAAREVHAIHKVDSPALATRREIELRTTRPDLPAPELYRASVEDAWFIEELVEGYPADRAPIGLDSQRAVAELIARFASVRRESVEHRSGEHIATALLSQIRDRIDEANGRLSTAAERLAGIVASADAIPLTVSHGDFQPGNILVGERRAWLIDWEDAGEHVAAYDPLIHVLGLRRGGDFAAAATEWLKHGYTETTTLGSLEALDPWTGADPSDRGRVLAAVMLEELRYRLGLPWAFEERGVVRDRSFVERLTQLTSLLGSPPSERRLYPALRRRGVVAVASAPPPVTGQGVAGQMLLDALQQASIPTTHINLSRAFGHHGDFGRRARDAAFVAKLVPRVVLASHTTGHCPLLYLHLGWGPASMARDALLIGEPALRGLPIVGHVHGGFYRESLEALPRPFRAFVKASLTQLNGVIVVGEELRSQFDGLLPPSRVHVVENGVEQTLLDAASNAVERRRPRTPLRALYFSNLIEDKGYITVLEVAALAARQRIPIEMTLAGGLTEHSTVDPNRFIAAHCPSNARWVGVVAGEARKSLFENADVLVLPSRKEGAPLVILEAMHFGLPVVASAVGGIPGLVRDGNTGTLIEPDNPRALLDALVELESNPETYCSMSAEALRIARSRYTEQAHTDSLLEVLERFAAAS